MLHLIPLSLEGLMEKEKTEIGSNGVWLVTREHTSKKHGKTYKRRRKVASPNRGPIRGS